MILAPEESSLPRLLEPEVMGSLDDARDYDTMDHTGVNRQFVGDFLAACATIKMRANPEILDVGTGTAQIPIELCGRDPEARIVAIDLAAHMLRLAQENILRAGFGERIVLELVDAKRLPYAVGRFAAVISNSIVHHIPDPAGVLAEAVRVTTAGGIIFVRDLARPRDEERVRRLVENYAADCNAHQRQLFEDSLRAALSVQEIRALVSRLGFDPAGVQPTSDRHWTWNTVKA